MKLMQKMIVLSMVFTALHLPAGEKSVFSFPQTAQGRRSAAYFAAFNAAGEGAMEKFLRENFSAEALRRDPVEQRLARFSSFKKQVQSLARAIKRQASWSVTARDNGWNSPLRSKRGKTERSRPSRPRRSTPKTWPTCPARH
jgi:hypothetical protein